MFKKSVLTTALLAAFTAPMCVSAADNQELSEIRAQMKQMQESYEARMQALENRLAQAEAKNAQAQQLPAIAAIPPTPPMAAAARPARAITANNAFNPAMALILSGTMANLSQDPAQYRLQGFMPNGGESGPGTRSFSVGESELTLSASVDTKFSGQLTFALSPDNSVSVEEGFFQTKALLNGSNLKVGRFMSSIGYINSQHAHTWDFVDAPLAYQAFFGGQYKPDGAQFKWLLPTDRFVEIGAELTNGSAFPGNDRNKNGFGAAALFAHAGDDLGENASWRAGISYLRNNAQNRTFEDSNQAGELISSAFSGSSATWIADAVFKWSPEGNSTRRNFKLQGEYFRRNENGTLAYDTTSSAGAADSYASLQSGWYLQGVYQFMPQWRFGLRYDRLSSGTPEIGLIRNAGLSAADFSVLLPYQPKRSSVMLDYSLSEFSRLRLQFGRDQSRPGATDNQLFLQYNMSLGAHGAHAF